MEYVLMVISVLVAALSGLSALYIYTRRPDLPAAWASKASGLYRLLYNKYFVTSSTARSSSAASSA